MTELLPCPFCGGAPILDNLVDDDDYFVHCTKCEVQQIANYTSDVAISRWNRRATAARLIAVVPDLLEAGQHLSKLAGQIYMAGVSDAELDALRSAFEALDAAIAHATGA